MQETIEDPIEMERPPSSKPPRPPKGRTPWGKFILLTVAVVVLMAVLFVTGYLPRAERERGIRAEAHAEETNIPIVNVAQIKKSAPTSELLLPGSMIPVTEAYIFARSAGYVKKRYVDIGDLVKQGELLAEIDAPDLDQQVLQAEAALSQAKANLNQVQAALDQTKAQERLTKVTLDRWVVLVGKGVLAKQEGDQKQADFDNATALVHVAEANIKAAQDNVKASEANVSRLTELKRYEKVTAPFAGVITSRSIDEGSLISASGSGQGTPALGSTSSANASGAELFREAQVGTLRIMVNVPQAYASSIHVGMPATVTLQENSQRKYTGKVTRTANSIDQNTRTLLTEVQVVNRDGSLVPGMYGNLQFISERLNPPLLAPGDSLVTRANGTQLAVVGPGNKIHFQMVQLGRDFGSEIEITGGLQGGERVVINPSDDVREGAEVKPATKKISE
jgi:multidrug efflux pump subunit AcrA (membrane-fusion protein)